MSAHPTYDDLDAYVTDGLMPGADDALAEADPDPERFVIDDESKAEWAMRKLARLARHRDEKVRVAEAERARIDAWLEAETRRLDGQAEFFEGLLAGYHERLLAEDPKAKTVSLPSGVLKASKARASVDLDEAVFVEWAKDWGHADLVEWRPKVSRTDVRKRFTVGPVDSDGTAPLVDESTGERVPGVTLRFGGVQVGSERVVFQVTPEGTT